MVSGSPSGSLSLASGAMVTGTSSGVLALSSTATGGSLTGVTVTVTVAVALPALPSLMVYWRVIVPLKLVVGLKSRLVPPTMTTVPLVVVASVMIRGSQIGRASCRGSAMVTGTASGVLALASPATGGALTGVKGPLTAAVVLPPLQSLT